MGDSDGRRIAVLATSEFEFDNAVPSISDLPITVHKISTEKLQKNLNSILLEVEELFQVAGAALSSIEVKEVKVAVAVSAGGEFSLLGITKGKADVKATFEIKFAPRSVRKDGQ